MTTAADYIEDPEAIATIMRRAPTSSLVQIVCGLRTHSIRRGDGPVFWIETMAFDYATNKPVRVRMDEHSGIDAASEELNRRIPQTESWGGPL